MRNEIKHTPLPWKAVSELRAFNGSLMKYTSIQPAHENYEGLEHLRMADGKYHVCRFSHHHDAERVAKHMADAAFIVRAVNAHADLIETLSKLTNEVSGLGMFGPEVKALIGNTNWNVLALRVQEARAAISKAEALNARERT